MRSIKVNLPQGGYAIHIESGLLSRAGGLVSAVAPHHRCLVVADANVTVTHASVVCLSLERAGYDVRMHEMGAGESGKTLETVRRIYDVMLKEKLERKSPVIAVGGGIVGDVAGYAAATYLRGVPLVQVPTTLLAMVDASIGGKTGVNHPLPPGPGGVKSLGKNLIGAFWQPRVVIVDPVTLTTLEPGDFVCGLAECIKHGLIADAGLLEFLATRSDEILGLDLDTLTELIERSATVKVRIVQEDEREEGRRALLNLGHTFAHALESFPEHRLKHGQAVSLGLVLAMNCAHRTGRVQQDDVLATEALLTRFGLPISMEQQVPIDRLMAAMTYDKKVAAGRIRLILPTGPGEAQIAEDVDEALIRECWTTIFDEAVEAGTG